MPVRHTKFTNYSGCTASCENCGWHVTGGQNHCTAQAKRHVTEHLTHRVQTLRHQSKFTASYPDWSYQS